MAGDEILELDRDECLARITAAPYGRIAAGAAGQLDVFPINHRLLDDTVIFRTAPGTKLVELTIHHEVVFEIDGVEGGEAYSVVVKGRAEELVHSDELERAAATGLHPWAAVRRDRWMRIVPTTITGRRFRIHIDDAEAAAADEVPIDES